VASWIDGRRTQAAPKAPQRKRPCRSRGLSVDPGCSFAELRGRAPLQTGAVGVYQIDERLGQGGYMSLETVLLIVILTFGFGSVRPFLEKLLCPFDEPRDISVRELGALVPE